MICGVRPVLWVIGVIKIRSEEMSHSQVIRVSQVSLSVSNIALDMTFCDELFEVLSSRPHFEEAEITDCRVTPADFNQVCTLLARSESLKKLDFRGCYMGPDCVQFLEILVARSNIRELNLCWNVMEPAGAEVLVNSLQLCPTLRILNLSSNLLGDIGVQFVAKGFASMPLLEELQLSQNEICCRGIRNVSAHLHQLPHLKVLDLSENSLRNEGAIALSEAFPSLGLLEILDLSWNGIASKGVQFIFKRLAALQHLKELSLAHNTVEGEGVIIPQLQPSLRLIL